MSPPPRGLLCRRRAALVPGCGGWVSSTSPLCVRWYPSLPPPLWLRNGFYGAPGMWIYVPQPHCVLFKLVIHIQCQRPEDWSYLEKDAQFLPPCISGWRGGGGGGGREARSSKMGEMVVRRCLLIPALLSDSVFGIQTGEQTVPLSCWTAALLRGACAFVCVF